MDARRLAAVLLLVVIASSTRAADDAPAAPPAAAATVKPSATSNGLDANMKLEDLVKQDVVVTSLSTVVTTVDRQVSTVGRSPAAVFVITPEMIKRSGARNIPEALRMAPGVDVARIDAATWAISIRGFNNRFANELLVQIDRRVVYSGTNNGVFWQMQDVVLADIDRIEVIRGPGTTIWGSNAVNGVINIITKKSSETQGLLEQSGGGTQERDFNTVRYGGKGVEGMTWRAYGQQFDRNNGWSDTGVGDSWSQQRAGFRADYTPTKEDTITLQGDIFNGYAGERLVLPTVTAPYNSFGNDRSHSPGGNVLFRYGKTVDADTSWQVQSYYDRYRHDTLSFAETRNTYDIDVQYQFRPFDDHRFIAGGDYRNSADVTVGSFGFSLNPPNYTTQWGGVFAEDTMTLEEDRWYFALGTRLEQNTFGHFQVEPTARLLFLPDKRQSAWLAVSRAIRNPSRVDTGGVINVNAVPGQPLFVNINGNPNFQPENLMAYEIGYRAAPTDDFSWDVAAYINDYQKLKGTGPFGAPIIVPPGIVLLPAMVTNNLRAVSYGFETTATYQMTKQWRLFSSYSLFEIHASGPDPLSVALYQGSSPHNQTYLRSSWDLSSNVQFDLIGRYVDRLTALDVPKYIEMDSRIGWQATKNLELSFVGQNLLNNHHLEFNDLQTDLVSTQVRRGWYAMVSWSH